MRKTRLFTFFYLCVVTISVTYAQKKGNRSLTYEQYIDQYKDIAIREMLQHKIPASITLAQGLLESGAGRLELAKTANNHFGIKCNGSWRGARVYKDDDYRNECFRSYRSAADSYEDHSQFLLRDRYSSLFRLKPTDYKGWAHGLRACGYATDPKYATKLIGLIETYELYRYDRATSASGKRDGRDVVHTIYHFEKLLYIVAQEGDDIPSLAKELRIRKSRLYRYNEITKDHRLKAGDLVYLQHKRSKASKLHPTHVVVAGESVYSISQKYGITMRSIVKRNKLDRNFRIYPGLVLKLR